MWRASGETEEEARVKPTCEQKWVRDLSASARIKIALQLREAIRAAKARPCSDCGNLYAHDFGSRMTFDHLDPEKKLFDIGSIGVNDEGAIGHRLVRMRQLLEEIAKAEVVCRDCHTKRERVRKEVYVRRRREAPVYAELGRVMRECRELALERFRVQQHDAGTSFKCSWLSGVGKVALALGQALDPFVIAPPPPRSIPQAIFGVKEPPRKPANPGPRPAPKPSDVYAIARAFRAFVMAPT
jgi:hypothetical protein